jgi:Uma2 family endonuclease
MRVRVTQSNRYYYPDYTVVCGEPQFEVLQGVDSLLNPGLIVEILSVSTSRLDRGEKWLAYQQIESLNTYLMVYQDRPRIEAYVRNSSTDDWEQITVDGIEATLTLASIGCSIPLARIYKNVAFPE